MERFTVPKKDCVKAACLIDSALAKAGGPPSSREGAEAWIKAKRAVQSHPALLNLVRSFCDRHGYRHPKWCQIAYRFPGERCAPEERAMECWHVDKGHFHALVGVYLDDNVSLDCGNFLVALDSQQLYTEKQAIDQRGITGTFAEIGIDAHQVVAEQGTLLSVPRMMCHGTAPNKDDNGYIRKVVWFRLRNKK